MHRRREYGLWGGWDCRVAGSQKAAGTGLPPRVRPISVSCCTMPPTSGRLGELGYRGVNPIRHMMVHLFGGVLFSC